MNFVILMCVELLLEVS